MARARRIAVLLSLLSLCLCPAVSSAGPRVISLYPGHTDNVLALGGELIGVSENDSPALGLPRFSPRAGAESLLALRPDLVLTRGLAERMNPGLSKILAQAGVRVESIEPPSWDAFPAYLRRLAGLLGLDPEAGVARLGALRREIEERAESARRASGGDAPRVVIEATSRELHTCLPASWAARLVALCGGVNAAADARPQREGSAVAPWGLERVLKSLDEGLDVYLVQRGAMNGATLEDVRARPWAGALAGVRLAEMPEAELSRPSLLGLERGGEELLKIFYGEASE
ncbi:MAG: ABC transporter substrate-binding protein [Fretibacterium sp.]|nr:ABC transporter substrate-binding protein [Fretibacterium sp.]